MKLCTEDVLKTIPWSSHHSEALPPGIAVKCAIRQSVQAALCGERLALSRGSSWALCAASEAVWARVWGCWMRCPFARHLLLPSNDQLWSSEDLSTFSLASGPCRWNWLSPTPVGIILTAQSPAPSCFQDRCLSFWWWWWWLWLLWLFWETRWSFWLLKWTRVWEDSAITTSSIWQYQISS